MDLTNVFEALILLIIAVVTTFLVPWLKGKMNADTLAEVQKWVKIAVQAAEMIYKESGMGKEKKNYVTEFLGNLVYKIDADALSNMIESAVLELKKGLENDA